MGSGRPSVVEDSSESRVAVSEDAVVPIVSSSGGSSCERLSEILVPAIALISSIAGVLGFDEDAEAGTVIEYKLEERGVVVVVDSVYWYGFCVGGSGCCAAGGGGC